MKSGNGNGASENAVWDATRVTLEEQHPAVADAVLRVAATHWFDEGLIAALAAAKGRPLVGMGTPAAEGPAPELLYVALETLPFVETYGPSRLRLHSRVRDALLAKLLESDRPFVSELSERAVEHLGALDEWDYDQLLELAYHLLVTDPANGSNFIESIVANSDVANAARLDRLVSYVAELESYELLPDAVKDRRYLWSARAASTRGSFAEVRRIANEGLERVDDCAVADELGLELAFACWQLGERVRAIEIAEPLATHRDAPDWIAIRATFLLGDLAEEEPVARRRYGEVLGAFVIGEDKGDAALPVDPLRWQVVQLVDEGASGPEKEPTPEDLMLAYSDDSRQTLVGPNGLLAEVFLRVGVLDGNAGRVATASESLQLAANIFDLLGDAGGYQRVQAAQLQLAARHGDVDQRHELIARLKQALEWSRSTNSSQLELQTLIDLAVAQQNLGELDGASECYEQAAALARELDDLAARATAAQGLAQLAISRSDFEEADRQLTAAAVALESIGPDGAQRLGFIVGDRWFAAGDRQQGEAAFVRVLEWASARGFAEDEAMAHLAIARVARSGLHLDQAQHHLQAAAALGSRIDPMLDLEVLTEYSTVLRLRRRDREAKDLDSRIEARAAELSLQPVLARLVLARADTESRRGELAAARISYEQAFEKFDALEDPYGMLNSLNGLNFVCTELGEPEEALSAAAQIGEIARSRDLPDWIRVALMTKASALVAAGRPDEAIDALLEAHRLSPDDPSICLNLGWVYLRADRYEESIEWSNRALGLEPENAFPYRNIGHALHGLNRLEEAKLAYEKAIEGRFGDEHFRNTLAELELLHERRPNLSGSKEIVAMFEKEQARLDTASGEPPPRRRSPPRSSNGQTRPARDEQSDAPVADEEAKQ